MKGVVTRYPLYSMLSLFFLSALAIVSASSQTTCTVQYSNWTACSNDGIQRRTVTCLCDGRPTDTSNCLARRITIQPVVQDCSEEDDEESTTARQCSWKWTRWSRCSAACGGGNTSRSQVCICEDTEGPSPSEWCDEDEYYGNETCDCNVYPCGSVPAFNKVYWVNQLPDWPLDPQTRFNCSLGYDTNATDTPKGKTYSRVLSDNHPELHPHFEWYYLAKEYITISINIANGLFTLPPSAIAVVNDVARLLENCKDWPNDQKYAIFGYKEKLGRLNNNIGGLSNVDAQMAVLAEASREEGEANGEESSDNAGTIALTILIPVIAALLIGVAVGLMVYYVKEKKNTVVEQAAFESEDEPSDEGPLKKGDNAGGSGGVVATAEGGNVPLEAEKPFPTTTTGGEEEAQPLDTKHSDDSEDHQ